MKPPILIALAAMAGLLAACGGGGSAPSATSAVPSVGTRQQASGVITVDVPGNILLPSASARRPDYVSGATTQAAAYVSGTAVGSTGSCVESSAGTSCQIAWSGSLTPGSNTFKVVAASSSNVLSEGDTTFVVVLGSGNNFTVTLNPVVSKFAYTVTSCATTSCAVTVTAEDASSDQVSYPGGLATPSGSVYTSGNTFDDATGGLLVTSSAPLTGTVSTATISAVGTGAYSETVTCIAATGSFTLDIGGYTASGVNSASLPGTATYPPSFSNPTGPTFSCGTGDAISSASGTISVNSIHA